MRQRVLMLILGVGVLAAVLLAGVMFPHRPGPMVPLALAAPSPNVLEMQYSLVTSSLQIQFGTVGSSVGGDMRAVIQVKETQSGTLQEVALPAEYEGSYWVYAGKSLTSPWMWAVAEFGIEGPGWELPIAASDDGGRTWFHLGLVRKPYYLAEFESLHMRADGHGSLTMFEDDYGQIGDGRDARPLWHRLGSWFSSEPPELPQHRGFYTWRTTDHGRTWSGPEIEVDDLEKLAEPE